MKEPIFTIEELQNLGFQEIPGDILEDGDYYHWWVFYKGDCELHITYNYTVKGKFNSYYVEINGALLQGRKITKKDVEFLIELM